mmetsp:Transcript_88404/g.176759  ORF Transcript_88404/g.176759 Transcript_88404/m.176759 type:complete len:82 (-) Transcript_88404:2476-2721(-)
MCLLSFCFSFPFLLFSHLLNFCFQPPYKTQVLKNKNPAGIKSFFCFREPLPLHPSAKFHAFRLSFIFHGDQTVAILFAIFL